MEDKIRDINEAREKNPNRDFLRLLTNVLKQNTNFQRASAEAVIEKAGEIYPILFEHGGVIYSYKHGSRNGRKTEILGIDVNAEGLCKESLVITHDNKKVEVKIFSAEKKDIDNPSKREEIINRLRNPLPPAA